MVQRQMLSNAKKQNKKIDFAVIWGWQHSRNQYNIQLSYVRMFFGDWLYGFSGEIEYRSGNDVQQGPDS